MQRNKENTFYKRNAFHENSKIGMPSIQQKWLAKCLVKRMIRHISIICWVCPNAKNFHCFEPWWSLHVCKILKVFNVTGAFNPVQLIKFFIHVLLRHIKILYEVSKGDEQIKRSRAKSKKKKKKRKRKKYWKVVERVKRVRLLIFFFNLPITATTGKGI